MRGVEWWEWKCGHISQRTGQQFFPDMWKASSTEHKIGTVGAVLTHSTRIFKENYKLDLAKYNWTGKYYASLVTPGKPQWTAIQQQYKKNVYLARDWCVCVHAHAQA